MYSVKNTSRLTDLPQSCGETVSKAPVTSLDAFIGGRSLSASECRL